jgi:cyclic pyranopterin phosphate synthase
MGETDLRSVLRDPLLTIDQKNEKLISAFRKTVADKLPGHGINEPNFIQPVRPMSAIGG